DPRRRWLPDGRPYEWAFAGTRVRIEAIDESGKVDLNAADVDLLSRLFVTVGVDQADATAIAAAIADWRDSDDLYQPQGGAEDPSYASAGLPWGAKDAPFDTVAEVEQVLGMTPAIYAKVAPLLTVYSGQARPDPNFAAAEVLQALGEDAEPILARRRRAGAARRRGGVGGRARAGGGGGGAGRGRRRRAPARRAGGGGAGRAAPPRRPGWPARRGGGTRGPPPPPSASELTYADADR